MENTSLSTNQVSAETNGPDSKSPTGPIETKNEIEGPGKDSTDQTNGTNGKEVDSTKLSKAPQSEEIEGAEDQNISKKDDSQQDLNGPFIKFQKTNPEHKKNIKSDPTTLETSTDPEAIRKQVEFYFSDSNLPTDWHLVKKVGFSANKPVPIKDIHTFSRMRRFQPYEAVVKALKESTLLEVTEDEQVRRKEPLPKDVWQGTMQDSQRFFEDKTLDRSIYAKGFGEEKPTTQFDIEAFFATYGSTNAVRLRRTFSKIFKGSVFVEFEDEETQKKFMALEPKPKWQGNDLLWKPKREYVEEKAIDFASGKKRQKLSSDDWKARREYDQKNRGRGGHRGHQRGRGHGSRGGRGGSGRHNDRSSAQKPSKPSTSEEGVKDAALTSQENDESAKVETGESKKRSHEEALGSENGEKATKTAKVGEETTASSKADADSKAAAPEVINSA